MIFLSVVFLLQIAKEIVMLILKIIAAVALFAAAYAALCVIKDATAEARARRIEEETD